MPSTDGPGPASAAGPPSNQPPPARLARSAGVIGLATMASRVLGLARDMVFATMFGAGDQMDAFRVAFRIPNLVRDLFAEGAMSAAFVPTFTRQLTRHGRPAAWRLGRLVISMLVVVTGVVSIAGIALADPLVRLFASGFAAVPGKLELTVTLARVMFPFLVLVALAVAFMGMLNALRHFFVPALSPALFNVGAIVSAVAIVPLMPWFGWPPMMGLAIGTLLGGLLQALVQWPALRREGFRYRFELAPRDPGVREVLWLMVPGTVGLAAVQVNVFVNTVLAETWDEEGETVDASSIDKRGEPYSWQDLPAGCMFATAGVDVQGDRLEVQILAWGHGEEIWAARYVILSGDPARRRVWDELDALLKEPLRRVDGRPVRVLAACIDTGGHHGAQVYAFCARPGMRQRRVFPIKGDDGPKPIWPVRHSLTKEKKQVWIVGSDTGKDSVYGRLKIRPRPAGEPNPGFIHFPIPLEEVGTAEFNAEYFAQLTSEKVMTTKDARGRPRRGFHLPPGKRNEALDTMVYAFAARIATRLRLAAGTSVAPPPDEGAASADAVPAEPREPKPKSKPPASAAVGRKARRDPAAIARMFRR